MTVLVHIGYHKTGSNWLQHNVFADPATGYRSVGHESRSHPVRRIVGERPFDYDADAVGAALAALVEEVEGRGLLPVVSLERLSGNPFTGGHDSVQIADRIRAALVDAKILVVIREQRSMIVANYKQYVKAGGTASLHQFLLPATSRAALADLFDFGFYEYEHLIHYYQSLFGPENVLVLPYEQLAGHGRAFVERISSFAGRPIPEPVLARLPYTTRSNQAVSALTIGTLRQVNRLSPRTQLHPAPPIESQVAYRLGRKLKKDRALDGRVARRLSARADAKLRQRVDEVVGYRYAESNRRTAELTGLDLAAYGWPV